MNITKVVLPDVYKNVEPIENDVWNLSCNTDVKEEIRRVRLIGFRIFFSQFEADKILKNKL